MQTPKIKVNHTDKALDTIISSRCRYTQKVCCRWIMSAKGGYTAIPIYIKDVCENCDFEQEFEVGGGIIYEDDLGGFTYDSASRCEKCGYVRYEERRKSAIEIGVILY